MRYLALVTDYDGTVAIDGKMVGAAVTSIERLRRSGRRAILVTGRRLDNLLAILPHVHLFDYVGAENGAVAYEPRTRRTTLLANPLPRRSSST
jgi:hydroxymethylpyrimidine pyrophosphatase-like HAD family hydrolase